MITKTNAYYLHDDVYAIYKSNFGLWPRFKFTFSNTSKHPLALILLLISVLMQSSIFWLMPLISHFTQIKINTNLWWVLLVQFSILAIGFFVLYLYFGETYKLAINKTGYLLMTRKKPNSKNKKKENIASKTDEIKDAFQIKPNLQASMAYTFYKQIESNLNIIDDKTKAIDSIVKINKERADNKPVKLADIYKSLLTSSIIIIIAILAKNSSTPHEDGIKLLITMISLTFAHLIYDIFNEPIGFRETLERIKLIIIAK